MKKNIFLSLSIVCMLLGVSSISLANTLYRCPNVNEFTYDSDGMPLAKTNLNGAIVNWNGVRGDSSYAKATSLKIVVLTDGGYGHPYQIRCTYNDQSGGVIDMYIPTDESYEAAKTSGSNWSGQEGLWTCYNSNVNECKFFVTKV